MIDDRDLFEHAVRRFPPPERSFDRLITRRDRKRRNKRVAAGALGVAVALAAILVGTSIIRSDERQPANPALPFRHNGAIAIVGNLNGIVSLIDSGSSRRGNCGDAKNASRTDLVLHSLNAGGQLRARRFGLTPSSATSSA